MKVPKRLTKIIVILAISMILGSIWCMFKNGDAIKGKITEKATEKIVEKVVDQAADKAKKELQDKVIEKIFN